MAVDLLDELGALERERQALFGPEWDDLAAGRLSLDQACESARARGLDEESIRRGSELFSPLDDQALLDAMLARLSTTLPMDEAT